MTEQNYEAWDGKSYPWPPPSGWYLAHDQKWWPEGYGPKDAASKSGTDTSPAQGAAAAPVSETPSATMPTVDSSSSGSASSSTTSSPSFDQDELQAAKVAPANQAATGGAAAATGSLGGARSFADESSSGGAMKWLFVGVGILGLLVLGLLISRFVGGGDSNSASDPYSINDNVGLYSPDSEDAVWALEVTSSATAIADTELGAIPAPAEGQTLVRANVTLQNLGGASDLSGIDFNAVSGDDSFTLDDGCMSQAGSLTTSFAGGASTSGFLCWSVADSAVDSLVLSTELDGVDGRVYFAAN